MKKSSCLLQRYIDLKYIIDNITIVHSTRLYSAGRYYLQMQKSSERASFSVLQNSSIPLKQRIRKIRKNSLKLLPLFFNPLCSYWEFQMEFIHMSSAWDWNVSMLKSYIFLITLLPPLLNTLVNMLQKLCWMLYVAHSLNSNLWLSFFSHQGWLSMVHYIYFRPFFLKSKRWVFDYPLFCLFMWIQ